MSDWLLQKEIEPKRIPSLLGDEHIKELNAYHLLLLNPKLTEESIAMLNVALQRTLTYYGMPIQTMTLQ